MNVIDSVLSFDLDKLKELLYCRTGIEQGSWIQVGRPLRAAAGYALWDRASGNLFHIGMPFGYAPELVTQAENVQVPAPLNFRPALTKGSEYTRLQA